MKYIDIEGFGCTTMLRNHHIGSNRSHTIPFGTTMTRITGRFDEENPATVEAGYFYWLLACLVEGYSPSQKLQHDTACTLFIPVPPGLQALEMEMGQCEISSHINRYQQKHQQISATLNIPTQVPIPPIPFILLDVHQG